MRSATKQDAETLSSLHKESFTRFYSQEDFRRFLENGCFCFVAEKDNQVAGFILMQRSGDDAEILTLLVSPLYQRRGIARTLLKQAEATALAHNLQSVFLEVRDGNQEAHNLYLHSGYARIATRSNYYQHGDQFFDAIVMRKEL